MNLHCGSVIAPSLQQRNTELLHVVVDSTGVNVVGGGARKPQEIEEEGRKKVKQLFPSLCNHHPPVCLMALWRSDWRIFQAAVVTFMALPMGPRDCPLIIPSLP